MAQSRDCDGMTSQTRFGNVQCLQAFDSHPSDQFHHPLDNIR